MRLKLWWLEERDDDYCSWLEFDKNPPQCSEDAAWLPSIRILRHDFNLLLSFGFKGYPWGSSVRNVYFEKEKSSRLYVSEWGKRGRGLEVQTQRAGVWWFPGSKWDPRPCEILPQRTHLQTTLYLGWLPFQVKLCSSRTSRQTSKICLM